MIVRTLEEITDSPRDTKAATWCSRRLLLKSDGVGFSLHDTLIYPGTETLIWYRHHIEAVYCIEGEGEVEETETGTIHPIRAGTLYTLNGNERHFLRAKTQLRLICVFNPPLIGNEVHDSQGVYPLEAAEAR
jgi:L-ectoine synthase